MFLRVFKLIVCIVFITTQSFSQDFSALWEGHYSYNEIVDVVEGNNKIYAAAESAFFEYDVLTGEIRTITTVQGLSGEEITTLLYSEEYQYVVLGYETGLIEIYSEIDGSVLSVIDILEKQNITPARKRINHFFEYEGLVYISTDYGVSVYDLNGLEFGDTYFLGNGGAQIRVNQVSVYNNNIYVACFDANGLKRASLDNPNLVDFQQWETFFGGNFVAVNTFNDKAYAVRLDRTLFEINETGFTPLFVLNQIPRDTSVSDSHYVIIAQSIAYVYDSNLSLVNTYQPNEEFSTTLTSGLELDGNIYLGTVDFGILQSLVSDNTFYVEIKPDGPLQNNSCRINAQAETVWVTYGEFTESLNPYPLNSRGISYLEDNEWQSIPFDSLLGSRELNRIEPNIFNPNQVFVSSFFDGLLEINNFEPTFQFNESNSGLESLSLPGNPNYIDVRITGLKFDNSGRLWVLNSRVDSALKSYDPNSGSWQSYSFSSIISDAFNDEFGFFDLDIDRNGTKWVGSYSNGLIAYNESNGSNPIRNMNSESQNIPPFSRFTTVAVDNNNQLWVGMTKGLRVLFNTGGFFEDPNPILRSIIILEDGIPKELLAGESILDIEVDGSNNKWVGTVDSGVFCFSPDGQNTIYHFTTDNSPLPSNSINDISIDSNNGIVYIATVKGLLSFRAGGSKTEDTLENAFVYPNPVRPEYDLLGSNDLNDINKGIKISGLTEDVNIKITDVEGNLVAEAQSNVNRRASSANYNFAIDGGTAIWNGKNLANSVVQSGVYLVMISDLDSFETKVLKVLIVR
ncbi:MAG: two-component regulator propeller domain-containing protein [Winogradskyella sp.]